jgi:hypothetical protein
MINSVSTAKCRKHQTYWPEHLRIVAFPTEFSFRRAQNNGQSLVSDRPHFGSENKIDFLLL